MRVVHINFDANPVGGATIAMLRWHRALRQGGIDSRIVCLRRPDAEGSFAHRMTLFYRLIGLAAKVFQKIVYGHCLSTGMVPTGIARTVNQMKPDVIVLHWLQTDTMAMREMLRFNAPVIWFHHDMWPTLGLTAHKGIVIPDKEQGLDARVKDNKRRIAKQMGSRLVPACASRWAEKEIVESGMFAAKPLVLPLMVEPCFTIGDRQASAKFRILNGARGGFLPGVKGGDRLLAALEMLPDEVRKNMEVVVFGENHVDEMRSGVTVRYVGRLYGEALAQAYRDADMFAFPSRYETFGQTKIEALACGTPVIAFDQTACAEGIEYKVTGWVAPADDVRAYADGLMYFYDAWANGHPVRVREDATALHSSGLVALQWQKAFENICYNVRP